MNGFGTSVIISSIVYAIIFFSIFHEIGFAIVLGGIMGFISTAFFQILGLNNNEKKEVIYSEKIEDTASNKEKIISMFAYQITSFGLSASESMSASRQMVEEALSELPNDIDPYKNNIGDEKIKDHDFIAPRLAAGLTLHDIKSYWNRPPLIIACEFKMRQATNGAFLNATKAQGENIEDAAQKYKRMFPRYGITHNWNANDKYNSGLTINDADLYPEFTERVNNWLNKASIDQTDILIEKYGSLNAALRVLIKDNIV